MKKPICLFILLSFIISSCSSSDKWEEPTEMNISGRWQIVDAKLK